MSLIYSEAHASAKTALLSAQSRLHTLVGPVGATPIIGCVHSAIDADADWHISMLAVDPDHQMAGIGQAIDQEVERQAKAAGVTLMQSEVIRPRETMIAWYRQRGYKPNGATLPFLYEDPSVSRLFRSDLELFVVEQRLSAV